MNNAIGYVKALVNGFAITAAPALKAAFIHAGKVFAYIVLSAALTEVTAYLTQTRADPFVFAAWNTFLAAARKALETLNS